MSTRPFEVESVKKFKEELVLYLTIHYNEVTEQICYFFIPISHFPLSSYLF